MANYSIQRSDLATGNITVTEASTNTATNTTLIGQNFTGYGDEIATNFLQMLENFATDVDPTANPRVVGSAIRGQLWYDTTGNGTLKVYNGATFDEMAKLDQGTVDDSVARYNSATGKWIEESRIKVTTGGVFGIYDSLETSFVTFVHDANDLNIAGTGAVDINVTGYTAVNLPAATLVVPLSDEDGGTGTNTYATGDILYASGVDTLVKLTAGSNGELLTLAGGVPTWAAAGTSVSVLDDLTDVTAAGAGTEGMLYKSAGDWLVSTPAELGWDNGNQDLTVANINAIAAANLIDRTAPGTISGVATFTNNLAMSTGDITLLDNDQIIFGTGSDVAIDFNATNFVIDGAGQFTIDSFTKVYIDGCNLEVDNVSGEALTLQGNFQFDNSSLTTWIDFRASDGVLKSRVGIDTGLYLTLDGGIEGVQIVGTDSNSKVIVSNGVSLLGVGTELGISTVAVGTSFKTSRGRIYNDINTGSGGYSVGYNETPQASSGALTSGGTYNVSIDDIGLLLLRTTSSATTISFGTLVTSPIGATVLVNNDNTGTCTITVSGMTLQWVDGSGGAAPTGNRTLARNSIATVRKKSGSVWQIWGNGIS